VALNRFLQSVYIAIKDMKSITAKARRKTWLWIAVAAAYSQK
jgi:hypothetical protein